MTVENVNLQPSNLTPGQRLMWLGQQVHTDAPLYNMVFTFTIDGAVDVAAFRAAFRALVAASDNLRTVIEAQDGSPQRVVRGDIGQDMPFVDLADAENPQAALVAWVDERRTHVFDLEKCLYESVLLKLGERTFVWYFNQHHIIMDASSCILTYKHLSRLYKDAVVGRDLTPPSIPPYADYIAHVESVQQTPGFKKAETYWQERLQQQVDPVSLYGEPDESTTTLTERVWVPLGAARMAKLEELATTPGIRSFSRELTFANLFGALVLAYLHRMTHNDTIRLGTPLGNRSTPALQEQLGMIIEVLFLQVDFSADETFASLVKKVAAANLRTLQNAQPGIGTAAHNRAYNVLMNFITGGFPDFADMPTTTRWVHTGHGDSNHKVRVLIHDWDATGTYTMEMDFIEALFDEQQRKLAVQQFLRVLDSYLNNPDAPIYAISLLSVEEYQRNIAVFNATDTPYPAQQTVVDLFEAQAARTPNAAALHLRDKQLTYAELNRRANALAQTLISNGVTQQTLVPVCADHSFDVVVAILAVLKAGGAYVPLDPTHPDVRLQAVLETVDDAPFVLVQQHYAGRFTQMGYTTQTITAEDTQATNLTRRALPQDLAYVMFTSGTTGKPKGVQVQHSGLTNYLLWAQKHYVTTTPSVFAFYSSLAFDLTVTSLFVPLVSGGALRIYPNDGQGGAVIRQVFEENAVDVIKLTPSHLALVRDMDLSGTRIRTLVVGGEAFKTELAHAIHTASDGRIVQFNEYGPTEGTVACMIHRYDPAADVLAAVPIGAPADNMRVYVLDDRLQPSAAGAIGELYISGVNVARGYLNQPDLTASRFMDDPFDGTRRMYKTGDRARWTANGQLEFLGRADDQVKVGGVRIELGEVEAALLAHPLVYSAAADVRGTPDSNDNQADGDERLVAYYVADDVIDTSDLRAFMSTRLPANMLPAYYVLVDEMPLTSNGKVNRKALPDVSADATQLISTKYAPPTTELEMSLVEIWQEVLQLERVGIHDNFFNIGGHSLPAIRVTSRIRALFDIDFPLERLFTNPTIAQLAEAIEEHLLDSLDALTDAELQALLEESE